MSKTRGGRRISTGIFLIFGALFFLAVGLFFTFNNGKYEKNGIKTEAVITEIDSYYLGDDLKHDVKVEFTVDGVKYGGSLHTYTSSMHVNKVVQIYYMPDDPYDFSYAESTYVPLILTGICSALCLTFAVVSIVNSARNNADGSKLTEKYDRTETTIRDVKISYNTFVNGQNPITLVCSDRLNNTYKKKFLYDGSVDFTIGDKIDVYVKKNNPKKYLIDIKGYREQKLSGEGMHRIDADY